MVEFDVEEVESARTIIRKLGKEIEQSELPQEEIENKLNSIDSVEEIIIEKLREILE